MSFRLAAPLAAALLAVACSAPRPRPLPGGPPPEYETPRSYSGFAGDAPPAPDEPPATPAEVAPPPKTSAPPP